MPHLCKQERKRPTPVRRRSSRNNAVLGRAIRGGWVQMTGMKVRSLVVFSNRSAFPRLSTQSAALLMLSDNCWVVVRLVQMGVSIRDAAHPHPVDRWALTRADVQASWHGVAPLRRSSASWLPASIGRLFAGVGRRHPVTVRKASLMTGSMWRVRLMRHQAGAQ